MSYTIQSLDRYGNLQGYYFIGFDGTTSYPDWWSEDKDDAKKFSTLKDAEAIAQYVNATHIHLERDICTVVMRPKIKSKFSSYDRAMKGI